MPRREAIDDCPEINRKMEASGSPKRSAVKNDVREQVRTYTVELEYRVLTPCKIAAFFHSKYNYACNLGIGDKPIICECTRDAIYCDAMTGTRGLQSTEVAGSNLPEATT